MMNAHPAAANNASSSSNRGKRRGWRGGGRRGRSGGRKTDRRVNGGDARINSKNLNAAKASAARPASSVVKRTNGDGCFMVGTCLKRCPQEEYICRRDDVAGGLSLLEQPHCRMPHLPPERDLVVKKLKRSSAGVTFAPSEVRTCETLVETMEYLLTLMDADGMGPDARFEESAAFGSGDRPTPAFIMSFCADRTRSIRKDFSLQGYLHASGPLDAGSIRVHEMCARMHIMNDHMLCEIPEREGHNEVLNRQECNNCLKALNVLYDKAARRGDSSLQSPREAEFRSYYAILNMETLPRGWLHDQFQSRPLIRDDAHIQLAAKIIRAFRCDDFESFFQLVQSPSTPYMTSCIMHGFFRSMRASAIRILKKAVRGKHFFAHIARQLAFETQCEATEFLQSRGIASSSKQNDQDASFTFDPKIALREPVKPFPRAVASFIARKRKQMRRDDIFCGAW